MFRTLMTAHVGVEEVRVSSREAGLAVFSREESELRDFLKYLVSLRFYSAILFSVLDVTPERCRLTNKRVFQIAVHQAMLFRDIGQCLGWSLLSFNRNVGVGDLDTIANAQSLQLLSPRNDRCVS